MVTAISLYIRARNTDVRHKFSVSNPIPKVYTIYGMWCVLDFISNESSAQYLQWGSLMTEVYNSTVLHTHTV